MKVLISADMEGVCGVSSWVQVTPPYYGGKFAAPTEYERARLRLTKEVNAAVEGAIAGGADEVIVNDAHNGMRNLIPEELHPSVRFITGSDKALGMMQGVQEIDDGCVFFIGYHAKAQTPAAPLAHTWTPYIVDVRLGGHSTGEFGINAAIGGHFGVAVALVCGDDKAVAQTRDFLNQEVPNVVVKTGYSSTSAIHLHPERVQAAIRERAEEAVKTLDSLKPWTLPKGCRVEIELDHPSRADQCLHIPGVDREGNATVGFSPADAVNLYTMFRAVVHASDIPLTP